MPSTKRSDTDGSTYVGSKAHRAEQAIQLVRYGLRWQQNLRRSTVLRSIAIYPKAGQDSKMWLLVAKGWAEGYRVVAFYRSPDLLTALLGLFGAIAGEKIVWKKDEWGE